MKRTWQIMVAAVLSLHFVLVPAMASALPAPVEKKLDHGLVRVYDFGSLKLHAYQTDDPMGDECFILETGKNLVGLESPAFLPNIADWRQYAEELGKPLTDVLIAYHPAGGKWYGNARSHATEGAVKAMTTGATRELTESLGKAMGKEFITEIPKIDSVVKGGENTVGGIVFEITEAGDGYDVAIPSVGVVYTHMLGADTHSILVGVEHMDKVISTLQSFKAKGYRMILSSHHAPESLSDVDTKIAYVVKARELAGLSKTKEDFTHRMKEAFPGYQGEQYLEMTAKSLFK